MLEAQREALRRAIQIIGGDAEVARRFNITPQAVGQWERCPVERAIALERATASRVTRYELRPDIYPPVELDTLPGSPADKGAAA